MRSASAPLVLALSFLAGAGSCSRGNAAAAAASPARPHRFPNVVLVDQDNAKVRFYDDLIRGKSVLLAFMFTSCSSLCPRTTANLARVQALLGPRLGRDVQMISISVDPDRDTPAALRAYAAKFGARPGWSFVTGSRADVEEIRRALGVYEKDKEQDDDKNQHTGMLIYGNEPRDRWSKIYALAEPQVIAADIERWLPKR